jgi:protein O-GlcNAc transferase
MNRHERRAAAKRGAKTGNPDTTIAPPDVATLFHTGVAHHQAGRLAEAESCYRQVLAQAPNHADSLHMLGVLAQQAGRHDLAVDMIGRAIRLNGNNPAFFSDLGNSCFALGRLDDAVAACHEVIRLAPDDASSHCNLGTALYHQNKLGEAVAAYREALRIRPDYARAHGNLGAALHDLSQHDAAVAAYGQALRIQPDDAGTHCNLGAALYSQGKLADAVAAYREALRIRPDYAKALCNLGTALADQGKRDEAIAAYREAIRVKPDYAEASSNLLVSLNYDERCSNAQLFAAHRTFDERHGRAVSRPTAYPNDRATERRLKVGYVSPDFRGHSVSFFLEPLLRHHDRKEIELFCYAEVNAPDTVTERFKGLADHFVVTFGMPDAAVAERVRRDGIDILVDLAGHMAKNRLGVFAHKPAPVQATWLGYPNTTGLVAIDYRLVDAVTDPEGESDAFASETLVRLANGFLCYGPRDAPAPTPPPCLATGHITFGSFNNPAKLSAATLDAWAALLARLPSARLLLKGKPFEDGDARARFLQALGERGVTTERVELVPWLADGAAHLALYGRIDIALDPFPYNGTTTTCEALWMGVPVVTLRGDRHAGRVGASLLTRVGLTDLIAGPAGDYVEIAAMLAGDVARLGTLRETLRPRMATSPLCDATGFARDIESAYRDMWRKWLRTPSQPAHNPTGLIGGPGNQTQ